jgi:hypothetical protein
MAVVLGVGGRGARGGGGLVEDVVLRRGWLVGGLWRREGGIGGVVGKVLTERAASASERVFGVNAPAAAGVIGSGRAIVPIVVMGSSTSVVLLQSVDVILLSTMVVSCVYKSVFAAFNSTGACYLFKSLTAR